MLKFLAFFLAVATPPTLSDRLIPTSDGLFFHQCVVPLVVVFDPRLPKDQKALAWEAFEYWNHVLGKEIFVKSDALPRDLPPQGYVVVRPLLPADRFPDNACAVTSFLSEEGTGCAGYTQVVVTMLCVNGNKNMMRTIMRHEIGHVLGLAHNDVPGDLMQPIVPEKGHPLHATPDEVRLLRELYDA